MSTTDFVKKKRNLDLAMIYNVLALSHTLKSINFGAWDDLKSMTTHASKKTIQKTTKKGNICFVCNFGSQFGSGGAGPPCHSSMFFEL